MYVFGTDSSGFAAKKRGADSLRAKGGDNMIGDPYDLGRIKSETP